MGRRAPPRARGRLGRERGVAAPALRRRVVLRARRGGQGQPARRAHRLPGRQGRVPVGARPGRRLPEGARAASAPGGVEDLARPGPGRARHHRGPAERRHPQPVKNDPPRVIFSTTPALLVLVDGKPVLRQVEGTSLSLQRVVNSWALILVDQKGGKHYLRAVGRWFEAGTLDGPWAVAVRPPAALDAAMQTVAEEPAGEPPRRSRPRGEGRRGAGRAPDRLRQHGAGRADPDRGPARLRAHRGHRPPPRPELVREHRARPGGPAPLRPPVRTVVPERVPGRGPLGVRRARQASRRLRQDPGDVTPGARFWPRFRARRRPRKPSSTTASPRPPR